MNDHDDAMLDPEMEYTHTSQRKQKSKKWKANRQVSLSPAEEAQIISEATQTATVAARSILAAGGSQATALKTAKAAAKSSLMGHNISDNDSVSLASTNSIGPRWNQKRKAKKQADTIASMALAAASHSLKGAPDRSALELAIDPPKPLTIQGEPQGLISPLDGTAATPKSENLVVETNSSGTDVRAPVAMQLPTITEQNSSSYRDDNGIKSFAVNSDEDPIYWGESYDHPHTSPRSKNYRIRPMHESESTETDYVASPRTQNSYSVRDETIFSEEETELQTQNSYSVREDTVTCMSEEETQFTELEERDEMMEAPDNGPFSIFGCGCGNEEMEASYNHKCKTSNDDNDVLLQQNKNRDEEREEAVQGTQDNAPRDDAERETEDVADAEGGHHDDNNDEIYHTIILKSRYEPEEDIPEAPHKVEVPQECKKNGSRRMERIRSFGKNRKIFRRKKGTE